MTSPLQKACIPWTVKNYVLMENHNPMRLESGGNQMDQNSPCEITSGIGRGKLSRLRPDIRNNIGSLLMSHGPQSTLPQTHMPIFHTLPTLPTENYSKPQSKLQIIQSLQATYIH